MPFLLAERVHSESARSMRAVKGSLGHSPKGKEVQRIRRPSLGLMARHGKSIAKQSEGRADKKYLPVGWAGEKVARSEDCDHQNTEEGRRLVVVVHES